MAVRAVPADEELMVIRCSGCLRTMGFAAASAGRALRASVFCSEWCAREQPTSPEEERNDHWIELYGLAGVPATEIARRSGVTPTAVYKVLNR